MAPHRYPYTYISCPCSDYSRRRPVPNRSSGEADLEDEDLEEEEEKTFDPRNPRSNFSLFPPEHLLYCEECHDIKCPRCVTEEIICWYCPSCLFETPSATVRSEGNRCARNCFNCPICTSQLITTSLGDAKEGPWILNCNYCMWTTLDIGIKFDKPTNIRSQLDKIANGGTLRAASRPLERPDVLRKSSLSLEPFSPSATQEPEAMEKREPPDPSDPNARFNALKAFYKNQIISSTDTSLSTSTADLAYGSPSSLARIMNLYTNLSNPAASSALKRANQKPSVMREALTPLEGLTLSNPEDSRSVIATLQTDGYENTASPLQRISQHAASALGHPHARTVFQLRPLPTLLRTKRSKRCKACKHILAKPEYKPTSTRYRIKLIALNYIPLVSLTPLSPTSKPGLDASDVVLLPGKASQWVLTLRNHLFESVQVSLGTPSVTPGRRGHKVTILAPAFEIGANSDGWENALGTSSAKGWGSPEEQVAGKVYERGRNWTSVVVEIVPASIFKGEGESLEEDEDVVEVPVRVRLEWRQSDATDGKKDSERVMEEGVEEGRRELAYWMVIGVGRVAC